MREWLSRLPKNNKTKILNALDSDGYSAMHYAAKFNRFKIMQLLIAYEAGEVLHSTLWCSNPFEITWRKRNLNNFLGNHLFDTAGMALAMLPCFD